MSKTQGRSIFIKTFGCQMNVYDSQRMEGMFLASGYEKASQLQEADVVLINTCSIRDKSEHKVLSLLGQLRPLKDRYPKKILGITGCAGQRLGRSLLARVPHLDLVLGPDQVDQAVPLVARITESRERLVAEGFEESRRRQYSQPAVLHRPKPAEYLTIMKGCDHFCTYCIVPFVRGREKSRPIAEVVADVQKFVDRGTREVTFLGQNINTYGKGTGETLAQLIEAVHSIPGLERIRYLTSHPRDLGEDLIHQFGRLEKLCPALHLPFQSGSDTVLKRMQRLYTRESYLQKVDALRKSCPAIGLSTDVIVGFPGETEADFSQTLLLLEEVGFSQAYLFKYSPRPGTRALDLGDPVSKEIQEQRLKRAQQVAFGKIEVQNHRLVGSTVSVLVEGIDKKGLFPQGRTPDNRLVHLLEAGPAFIGKIVDVEVTVGNVSGLQGVFRGNHAKVSASGRTA